MIDRLRCAAGGREGDPSEPVTSVEKSRNRPRAVRRLDDMSRRSRVHAVCSTVRDGHSSENCGYPAPSAQGKLSFAANSMTIRSDVSKRSGCLAR